MKSTLLLVLCLSFFFGSCKNQEQKQTEQVQQEPEKITIGNHSGITSINLTSGTTENLLLLGKIWGFLKYHHPAVAAGKYNWDQELFRLMPLVLQAKSNEQRNSILYSWVENLSQVNEIDLLKIDSTRVKLLPDLKWLSSNTLGDQLASKLRQIQYAKRTGYNFYVHLDSPVRRPCFIKEEPYAQLKNPDLGFRLLALFRFWNIIQYFYPYRTLTNKDWQVVLQEYIPLFARAHSPLQYQLAISALLAEVKDGHARLLEGTSELDYYNGNNFASAGLSFIQGKAVVTHYLLVNPKVKPELLVGDIIEAVNGKTTTSIIQERMIYTSASNATTALRTITAQLLRTNNTTIRVTFKRGNISKTTNLACFPNEKLNFTTRYFNTNSSFRLLSKQMAYLLPGKLKKDEITNLIPRIAQTKGLIVDLRVYPASIQDIYSLGEFLTPESKLFAKITAANVQYPGLFTFVESCRVGKINASHYRGRTIILVNEYTYSLGEFMAMALGVTPHALIIGSQTAGIDGNITNFYLPGGIQTSITGIGVYYPNGGNAQQSGIKIDLEVKPTIKGIKEGKDELLEKAIELLNRDPHNTSTSKIPESGSLAVIK